MFKRVLATSILLFLFTGAINAQTQGCLVNGVLYNTSSQPIANTQCGWEKKTTSSWTSTQQNQCASYGGISGGFIQVPCPIDNYVWIFGSGLALIAIIKLKNSWLVSSPTHN